MNIFESFFLNLGFSWSVSKILPYVLFVLLGVILLRFLRNKLNNFSGFTRRLVQFFTIVIFFILYFSFYPIYEGDFTNSSEKIERTNDYMELHGNELIVLSIPGCPYCYESIGRMKKLIERNPRIQIKYIVCSNDTATIDWYKEEAGDDIKVELAKNPEAMIELAKGSFPTFVLVKDNSPLKVWSNNFFGVLAMDEVEGSFQ